MSSFNVIEYISYISMYPNICLIEYNLSILDLVYIVYCA